MECFTTEFLQFCITTANIFLLGCPLVTRLLLQVLKGFQEFLFIYFIKHRCFTILSSKLHITNLVGNLKKVYGTLSKSTNK